jgi:hypothetical protein
VTIFLACCTVIALLGFASMPVKGNAPAWLPVALQALDVVLVLGLASLTLWSYLS